MTSVQREEPSCAHCDKKSASLQTCSRCHKVQYCGRDCQKSAWKTHKKECSALAQPAVPEGNKAEQATSESNKAKHAVPESKAKQSHMKGLEKHVATPFTNLDQGVYLHDRPETDVFKLLIDSFRMRQADDYNFEGKVTSPSVYVGAPSSIKAFRLYLKEATNLLPSWWTAAKTEECVAFGESGAWSDLRKKVTKSEITDYYGDGQMPMQLCMLAEMVYGSGPMGQDGTGMRKMMMQVEGGGVQTQFMSMMGLK
jgi:splicing suppressor protein 51